MHECCCTGLATFQTFEIFHSKLKLNMWAHGGEEDRTAQKPRLRGSRKEGVNGELFMQRRICFSLKVFVHFNVSFSLLQLDVSFSLGNQSSYFHLSLSDSSDYMFTCVHVCHLDFYSGTEVKLLYSAVNSL